MNSLLSLRYFYSREVNRHFPFFSLKKIISNLVCEKREEKSCKIFAVVVGLK